jgi:hypothetical protein
MPIPGQPPRYSSRECFFNVSRSIENKRVYIYCTCSTLGNAPAAESTVSQQVAIRNVGERGFSEKGLFHIDVEIFRMVGYV